MDNKKIITYKSDKADTLKTKSKDVESFDSETKDIVKDMKKVFEKEKKSDSDIIPVGLAAPQIGIPKRIFVVHLNDTYYVFINPTVKPFGKNKPMIEGCLSFPDIYVNVDRPEKVKVKYFNEDGQAKKIRAQDFMAKVIQHENDHLEGILLSDQQDFINAKKKSASTGTDIKEILEDQYFRNTEN